MTSSYTKSESFTIINARKLGAKVATDMHLCAHYYGKPTEAQIRDYSEEIAQFLNEGYLLEFEFGFKRGENRVVSWRYKVDANGTLITDDKAGKIVNDADIANARFFTFLTWNVRYSKMSLAEQEEFFAKLPFRRTDGSAPTDGLGYWTSDRNYYSGGQGLGRETFRLYS